MRDLVSDTSMSNLLARGTLRLMYAQIILLVTGYLIHIFVTRFISPSDYARFGVILSLLMISQIFLNIGIPEAASKYISEGRDSKMVKKICLHIQILFSFGLFIILFLIAPFLSDLLNDPELIVYIRLASLLIPVRALVTLFRGFITGFRLFKKAAVINMLNGVFQLLFVVILILLGYGLFGAIGGYVLGSFVVLWFAFYLSRNTHSGKEIDLKEIVSFSFPLIGFGICYMVLINLDMLFIKAMVADQDVVGYYTAARTISSIFYGVLITASFTLLPSISKSYAQRNELQVTNYIQLSSRYLLLLFLPVCVFISVFSKGILGFLFPPLYTAASDVLSILVFGFISISIFIVFGSVINAVGKSRTTFSLGMILLVSSCILNYQLIKLFGLLGAAYSMLIVGIVGILLFAIIIYKLFHCIISFQSLAKILLGNIIIFILLKWITSLFVIEGLILILFALCSGIIYLFIMILLKEVDKDELLYFKNLISNKDIN